MSISTLNSFETALRRLVPNCKIYVTRSDRHDAYEVRFYPTPLDCGGFGTPVSSYNILTVSADALEARGDVVLVFKSLEREMQSALLLNGFRLADGYTTNEAIQRASQLAAELNLDVNTLRITPTALRNVMIELGFPLHAGSALTMISALGPLHLICDRELVKQNLAKFCLARSVQHSKSRAPECNNCGAPWTPEPCFYCGDNR